MNGDGLGHSVFIIGGFDRAQIPAIVPIFVSPGVWPNSGRSTISGHAKLGPTGYEGVCYH